MSSEYLLAIAEQEEIQHGGKDTDQDTDQDPASSEKVSISAVAKQYQILAKMPHIEGICYDRYGSTSIRSRTILSTCEFLWAWAHTAGAESTCVAESRVISWPPHNKKKVYNRTILPRNKRMQMGSRLNNNKVGTDNSTCRLTVATQNQVLQSMLTNTCAEMPTGQVWS